MRWAVFARDGFTCRYCGAQAGQDGVELHADHVVSVADGGTDTYDNLVTACQKCNGGKGARSIQAAPAACEVVSRLQAQARTIKDQADAMKAAIEAKRVAEQAAVDLKCGAYGVQKVRMRPREATRIAALCREFGADVVLEWYHSAASRKVSEWEAVLYVSGIARKVRATAEESPNRLLQAEVEQYWEGGFDA
jgi:hypothetical protein